MRNYYSAEQSFEIEEVIISTREEFYKKLVSEDFNMFRGEADSSWKLNSSIVRKIMPQLYGDEYVLDFNKLNQLVSEHRNEYELKISKTHKDARFLFYLQHSISLSPFIDITKNVWIALSFALEKIQKRPSGLQGNAAIYAFKILGKKGENRSVLTTQEDVLNVLKRLTIGINKNNLTKENVETYILSTSDMQLSNDRMMYQQGSFLLLNNYSLNSDNISMQRYSDKQIKIVKFILSKDILGTLYFDLREKYPTYTMDYLLNPYLSFEDIYFKI